MKRLLLALSLAISSFALEGQTARLECFNCTKLPNDVCLPCLAGTASSEYSQGIMYHQGPNSRVFIRKPYSVSVKGVFVTLTDYTGKALTFDGTKTTHGSLTSVLNIINQCNCNIVGGGGPPGSFTISGDTGSGDVTGTLAITTGNTLRTVGADGSLLLDWDLTAASPNSIPYYTSGGTSNVNWRTFATGIVDDPTVVGSDQTSLQTVLNNLNSGGGGSYTSNNGITLASSNFKLGGTLSENTTITTGSNSFQLNQGTWSSGSLGGRINFNGGSAASYGTFIGSRSLTTSSQFSVAGDDIIITSIKESTGAWSRITTSGGTTPALSMDVTDGSEGGDATLYSQTRKEFIFTDIQRYNTHASAWAAITNNALYKLNNDPTVYHKQSTGQTYDNAPQGISKYLVTISGANSGSVLNVISYGTGVTASFASNKLTITIPSGARLLAANWRLVAADIQASADAAGTTNWVQVEFVNSGLNTGLTDFNVPTLQKTAIPTSGALSVTNAATMDLDNNPAMSVIGISSGTLTLRIGGLAVGSQGYLLTLNNL